MKTSLINRLMLASVITLGTLSYVQADATIKPKVLVDGSGTTAQKLQYDRICFLDTRDSAPFVRILENDKSLVTTFQLSKKLQEFKVIHQWIHNYSGWTLTKIAYKGKAKSYIGKALEAAVSSDYDGSILVDQYKANYIFALKLNSISELPTILNYFATANITPNVTKNILFVTTEDGSNATKLSQDEMTVLATYFDLQDALNPETSLALLKSLKATLELCADLNNSNGVIPLYGNQQETVVALLNKEFYNFEGQVCFPLAIKLVLAGWIMGTVIKHLQTATEKSIPNPIDAAKNLYGKFA